MGRPIPGAAASRSVAAAAPGGGFLKRLLKLLVGLLAVVLMLGGSWLLYTEQAAPIARGFADKYLDFNGNGIAGALPAARCG